MARAQAGEPWGERAMGSRRALGDHDQVIAVFIGERFDELLEALHREADDAARRADLAAQELLAAFENREQVAARVGALTAAVRVPRPGDIERSRMEPATNAARALMESGGERAPRLRIDPRRRRRHDRACARVAVAGADVRMTDQAPADPDFFQRAAVAKAAGKRRLLAAIGVVVDNDEDDQPADPAEREQPDTATA